MLGASVIVCALLAWKPGLYGFDAPRMQILAVFLPVALAWAAIRGKARRTEIDVPLLFLLAVYSVSCWRCYSPRAAFWGFPVFRDGSMLSMLLVSAAWYAGAWDGDEKSRGMIRWVAIVLAVHAVLQRLGRDPLEIPSIAGRATSMIGSPVYLGAVLAVACVESIEARDWLVVAILGAGIVSAGARSAVLGVVAGIVAIAWLRGWRPKRVHLLASLLVSAGIGEVLVRRGLTQSDLQRMIAWRVGLSAWMAKPWLGWGPMMFPGLCRAFARPGDAAIMGHDIHAHAHCGPLNVLAATGMLGLVAWLPLVWKMRRHPVAWVLLAISLVEPCGVEAWVVASYFLAS